MASSHSSARINASPSAVLYPSLKIRYTTWRTASRRAAELGIRGHLERFLVFPQALARPVEALAHRLLFAQEGRGDLWRWRIRRETSG